MKKLYVLFSQLPAHRFFFSTVLILLIVSGAQAQTITGTVYRDFDSNGIYAAIPTSGTYAYGEPGVPGVVVTAYPSTGTPISATTNSVGSYTINVGNGNPYRVEFTNLVTGDYESFRGTNSQTSVRFVTGGASSVNLGVNYPPNYCGVLNPYLATSCYTNGDPTKPSNLTNNPANDNWMVGWQYDGTNTGRNTYLSKGSIGSTWGLAYQRTTNSLFAAAFMKRHSGFGTGGPGQIYKIDVTNPLSATGTVVPFVNLTTDLGIPVGTDPRALTALPVNKFTPNYDAAAFDLVGKMSLGDIDISDDERTLWVMNLFDKALYELPIGLPATKPTTFTKHLLPTGGCVNGTLRPFATKYYRGKVYVGAVCSAENAGGTASNLTALVYAHDPAGADGNFTQVLSFPLTYTRGFASSRGTNPGTGLAVLPGTWRPWIDQWTDIPSSLLLGAYDQTVCPQPMLSDIEFDVNGEMVIAMMDRFGHQAGNLNYSTISSTTAVYEATAAGDMLRAGRRADGTYQLESNAIVTNIPANSLTPITVTSQGTNQTPDQGPGGAEFYWQDMYPQVASPNSSTADGGHQEILVGGITLLPGTGEVVSTAFDPFSDFRAAGARYYNNTTGGANYVYEVISQDGGFTSQTQQVATFGKAASLGDLEVFCEIPPIQIGNRVWNDLDNDGVQDANEPALGGVVVNLKGPGLPTAGVSVTTSATGEYYFSNGGGSNTTGFVYGLTTLTSGGSYTLTFPLSASANTLYLSTKPNTATGTNADVIDTDPNTAGIITFTLGQAGENNFSYDAAYTDCALTVGPVTPTCNTLTNQYTLTGTISFTNTPATNLTISAAGATTVVSVTAGQPSLTFTLSGTSLISNGPASRTLTIVSSASSCGTASATYTVPATCTVCPTLTVTPTTLLSGTVGVGYSQTLTTTGGVSSYTYAVVGGSLPAGLSLSPTGVISGTPTASVTTSFSVRVTDALNCSAVVPLSLTVVPAPVCGLSLTVTPGLCQSATNTYTLTSRVGAVNVPASGTLTVSSGAFSPPFVQTIPAGSSTGTLSFSGLVSNGSTFTVTASFSNTACAPVSETYTAPASCSVAPPCSLTVNSRVSVCDPATNTYSSTVSVGLTNPVAGVLTLTDGVLSQTVTITGSTTSAVGIFNGLISDGTLHQVSASLPNCGTSTATYTAPASCSVAPPCSATLAVTAGLCQSATNAYSATATLTVVNVTTPQTVTITIAGVSSQAITLQAGTNQVSFDVSNLPSDGLVKIATATFSGTACASVSNTYTAPASCSVAPPCSVTLAVTPGECNTLTNAYSATAVLTAVNIDAPRSVTINVAGQTQVFSLTATGTNTVVYVATNLPSEGALKTATATFSGTTCANTSATFTAPMTCTSCALMAIPTAGLCQTATNTYSSTVVVVTGLTGAGGVLTVTDGTRSVTLAVASGLSSFTGTAVFNGLVSDGTTHTVTATLPGCTSTSTTYTAPASCSIAPVCSATLTVTPGLCQTATNTYSATSLLIVENVTVPQTVTLTVGGVSSVPVSLSAGRNEISLTTIGLQSDGLTKVATATFSGTACASVSATFTAPMTCTSCTLMVTPTAGLCQTATNTFSSTVAVVTGSTGTGGTLTISDGSQSFTLAVAGGLNSYTGTAVFTNLPSDGSTRTVTATLPGCASTSATYTAPQSCTATPTFDLQKRVSSTKVQLGDVVSYTLILTNTSTVAATNVVVSDTATAGIVVIPGSATASLGTFTQTLNGGDWVVPSLPAGTTATLVYSVSMTAEGVAFNTAFIPGKDNDTQVCTTIPYKVCKGQPFAFELSAPAGYSRYQWYLTAPGATTATLVSDSSLNSFTATLPGEYRVVINEGVVGQCPQTGCCPVVIEETEVPLYTVLTQNPTCVGSNPQANGQLQITGFTDVRRYQFQLSSGTSFDAASATVAASIPTNGIIASNLAVGNYTVRVIDRQTGCFRDVTVALTANCACPEEICVPVTIKKTKSQGKVVTP
ncbi:SdrD B-like domain-containing protein [Rudanella lutea]|uniref:SdrD B-like domain-containing protein n=1 Tax=Rudanella lutea TaxID=451374 RepID=UPI00036B0C20|nr:SdrD B-like domain-containing protein [Rudanella lutea]